MARLAGLFVAALFWLAGSAGAQAPTRVALVIANAHYAGYPELPNTLVDEGLVADALKRAGFAVEIRTDLDGGGVRDALARFSERANGAQVALIYFAGHGMAEGGRNWLLPTGARLERMADLGFNAVPSTMLVDATAGARARVIVLDACRNNPLAAKMRGITRDASAGPQGLAPPASGAQGTLFLYSADVGQTAQDGPNGRGSPFARAFAASIVRPGMDLRRVAGAISSAVFNETGGEQTPFQTSSLSEEEFVMVPGAAPAPPSVATITVLGANVSVSELGAEVEALGACVKANTAGCFRDFLRRFPNARQKDLAELVLASLERPAAAPAPGTDPLAAARAAVAAITPEEWSAAESAPLVARVVAASSRDGLVALANAGNARAQLLAGRAYDTGLSGFSENKLEAVRLYKLAAAQNDARGQSNLGIMYEGGEGGLAQDKAEAVRLYRLAVAQGNALGQVNLGVGYENGYGGLEQDKAEAVRLFRLAAAQGNATGQANLGNMYQYGYGGLAQDQAEAVRLYRLAAAQGNAFGQAKLGNMYQYGKGGLTQDKAEAVRLYRLAAVQGDALGQVNLGAMYDAGEGGLTQDKAEAVRLYRLAAAQGNAGGQANLGVMYENGEGGLTADRAEAVRLYKLAAQQGNAFAQDQLRRLGETW